MSPTRAELRRLVNELRHARTGALPLELAERVQHAIVRLEDLLVSPTIDPVALDLAYQAALELLRACAPPPPGA